ncbi:McrB family protein [Flavobacterium sp. LT1R49]|uniref:McrB family protein n=1 Tax=Flavobacterium arabinosi TaxID=3398737 RepID=UPI003A8A844F
MKLINLSTYLEEVNKNSKFNTILAVRGGYITAGNTGGKSYSLGFDSIISFIKDVLLNLNSFEPHSTYHEKKWRELASKFISDSAAEAAVGTQTKAFFTSFGKLINWANEKSPSEYTDAKIDLEKSSLEKTIHELESLADLYAPKQNSFIKSDIVEIKTVVSEKDLKHFAFKTFKLFLDKYGYEKVVKNITEKDSKINETEYTGIKIKPYFGSGNLIGAFDKEQNKDALSSSNTPRFFEENLHLKEYPYSYFTTQWGDVDGGGTLSFNNLQKFVTDLSNGDFEANKVGDIYSLLQKSKSNKSTLQKIYYGAPGTGKSHKIESLLQDISEGQKERITFHPEYDYSCFVGGYKPSSEKSEDEKTEEIKYKFVPQVFTNIYVEAWKNPSKDYFLAIEEINRGNCAEIFGDLFQILDRNSNYSISPSKELKEHLETVLIDEKSKKGIDGGKMKLPSNLNILASMNTSDQSLFPMDSAFKRRWAWEYVPINYEEFNNDATEIKPATKNDSFEFTVKIDDIQSFKWVEFIESVNAQIKSNRNLGSDKCIGNYFIKPDDKEILLEEFINKAMFYLWIDVFKDEEESIFSLIGSDISYEDFFPINTKGKENLIKLLSSEILNVAIVKIELEGTKEEIEK